VPWHWKRDVGNTIVLVKWQMAAGRAEVLLWAGELLSAGRRWLILLGTNAGRDVLLDFLVL
jgi:hypothetical protein